MSLEEEFGIATNNALIIADLHLEEFEKWWKENNLEICRYNKRYNFGINS